MSTVNLCTIFPNLQSTVINFCHSFSVFSQFLRTSTHANVLQASRVLIVSLAFLPVRRTPVNMEAPAVLYRRAEWATSVPVWKATLALTVKQR